MDGSLQSTRTLQGHAAVLFPIYCINARIPRMVLQLGYAEFQDDTSVEIVSCAAWNH